MAYKTYLKDTLTEIWWCYVPYKIINVTIIRLLTQINNYLHPLGSSNTIAYWTRSTYKETNISLKVNFVHWKYE